MKTETIELPQSDEVLGEVWALKDENAAAYDYDIEAIACAARKHQEVHPERVVRRSAIETDRDRNAR